MMLSDIKRKIKKRFRKHKTGRIKIGKNEYEVFVYNEEPRGGFVEGFMLIESNNKREVNRILKFDPYSKGQYYCGRIVFVFHKDELIIRDALRNININISDVGDDVVDRITKAIDEPTEENIRALFQKT